MATHLIEDFAVGQYRQWERLVLKVATDIHPDRPLGLAALVVPEAQYRQMAGAEVNVRWLVDVQVTNAATTAAHNAYLAENRAISSLRSAIIHSIRSLIRWHPEYVFSSSTGDRNLTIPSIMN